MAQAASPRLLFVIDNDFGALATVAYLMHGEPLAAHTTLFIPRRVHELHGAGLPIASRPYDSLRHILDFIDAHPPDVVFLFSGYLLTQQHVLSIRALRRLLRTLRERGCKVATSDPFLGTFRSVAEADVPARAGIIHRLLHARRVARHVRKVSEALAGVTHVYPVPTDALESGGPAKRLSFFNPLYIRAGSDATARAPQWLFVLASFDLEFQRKKHGERGFTDIVAARIREALDNGRRAAFIGPASVTQALAAAFSGDSRVRLLAFCPFAEYERLLLEAEVVFQWNILSTSAFLRLWNGLPVFFFDEGHVPRILRPLHEAGLRSYYLGAGPVFLDIAKPLDAERLRELASSFAPSAGAARARLAGLPGIGGLVKAM